MAKSTNYKAPHYPVFSTQLITLSLFGPNILSTLFSKTHSLCPSFIVRDQVSYSYRTTSKIKVLYILIAMFFYVRREEKRLWTEWQQALPELDLSKFLPQSNFDLLLSFPST
jgi:hypothetical protein